MKTFLALLLFTASTALGYDIKEDQFRMGKPGSSANKTIQLGTTSQGKIRFNPSLGKLQFSNDGTLFSNVGAGGSGGSKNYLSAYTTSNGSGVANTGNGDFEANSTTGFSLFNTTLTSGIPTGSITAGAATITTFASTGTTPIAGNYSLSIAGSAAISAGAGFISDAFYIDSGDKNKVLNFSYSYAVQSGASNLNTSGTSSNTFHTYIYDVTNSAWIQPAGVYAMNQNSGTGRVTGSFQSTGSSTQYRIAVIAVNASAGAAALYFDDFTVGPGSVNTGAAVSDWVSYTPAAGTWSSNITYTGSYRRVGDSAEITVKALLSGAGTNANFTFTLPSGLSIDSTKFASTPIQFYTAIPGAQANLQHSAGGAPGYVAYYDSTHVNISSLGGSAPTTAGQLSATAPYTWASGDYITAAFTVPIVGWSSNTSLSNDTDSRVVALRVSRVAAQSIPNTTLTQVAYDTVYTDTHGAFTTGASANYKVPVSGIYSISSAIQFAVSATGQRYQSLFVNGVNVGTYGTLQGNSVDFANSSFSVVRQLNAGDVVAIQCAQLSGGALNISDGIAATDRVTLNIFRLSGPSSIAASESVNARFKTSIARTVNNTSPTIVYETVDYDSHGAYNSTTGSYTVPVSGKYRVSGYFETASVAATVSQSNNISLYKNGSVLSLIAGARVQTATSTFQEAGGSTTNSFLAGDIITIRGYADTSNTLIASTPTSNWIAIERVGN